MSYKPKYFTSQELTCDCGCGFGSSIDQIDEKLLRKLDQLREAVSQPVILTSAARCFAHNKRVGGSSRSAHTANPETGQSQAVDILALSGPERMKLVKHALALGFARIGIAKQFVHLDVATHLPQHVMWVYS